MRQGLVARSVRRWHDWRLRSGALALMCVSAGLAMLPDDRRRFTRDPAWHSRISSYRDDAGTMASTGGGRGRVSPWRQRLALPADAATHDRWKEGKIVVPSASRCTTSDGKSALRRAVGGWPSPRGRGPFHSVNLVWCAGVW